MIDRDSYLRCSFKDIKYIYKIKLFNQKIFSFFRIKSFEFERQGFTFEMSKLLTLSDIAFRVLFTKFDHYSLYSKSHMLRIKQKVVEGKDTNSLFISFMT